MDAEWDRRKSQQITKHNEWYNASSRPLPHLNIGTKVRMQHPVDKTWETSATIVKVGSFRNYLLKLPSGRTCWRNRRYIRSITFKGGRE